MSDYLRKPWFIDGRTGVQVSYGQLAAEVAKGCPTLFQPRTAREALVGITAALASGEDVIMFDADFGPAEIAALGYTPAQLQGAARGVPGTITGAEFRRLAAGAARIRFGLFTSGSTGLPKLVWQSAANLARAVRVSPKHAESVWALAYNPTHVAAIQVYLQALANGCTVVDVYGLDRAAVLAALERHGVTHISATPSFYRLLLPADKVLAGVRSVTLGGESADARLLTNLAGLFPGARLHNVYASTEAGTLLVADGEVFGIAPGLEGRVAVRDGRLAVHRDLLGEFAGGSMAGDWYDTGDVIETVSEQPLRFRIVARERDWVNVGGSKVNPHEVEGALCEHPAVQQARVFGRKNSVMGNVLCAEVALRKQDDPTSPGLGTASGPVTEATLREWLGARLQPFKIPRMIRFVDNLATTRTGKLSRA